MIKRNPATAAPIRITPAQLLNVWHLSQDHIFFIKKARLLFLTPPNPLFRMIFRVNDHPHSGWLGFYRHRRKRRGAECLNRCGCNRARRTRFGKPNHPCPVQILKIFVRQFYNFLRNNDSGSRPHGILCGTFLPAILFRNFDCNNFPP